MAFFQRYNIKDEGCTPDSREVQMIPVAGPLLSSFLMYDEIEALRYLVPSDFVLYLALLGLLLTLLLDFRHR
ncbi:MAG: hypothetical protein OEM47_05995 [Deltaproteobacteria bacterium]|nr:hypothetical protein [Deltaproteobacteria bacterium]